MNIREAERIAVMTSSHGKIRNERENRSRKPKGLRELRLLTHNIRNFPIITKTTIRSRVRPSDTGQMIISSPQTLFLVVFPAGKGTIISQSRVWPFPFTKIVTIGERNRNPGHRSAGTYSSTFSSLIACLLID